MYNAKNNHKHNRDWDIHLIICPSVLNEGKNILEGFSEIGWLVKEEWNEIELKFNRLAN